MPHLTRSSGASSSVHWLSSRRRPNDAPYIGDQLLLLVPSTLGDFAVRLGIGAILVTLAVRYRADWLAFTAAAIAVPTLWVARLATLVGVPRLVQRSVPPSAPPTNEGWLRRG